MTKAFLVDVWERGSGLLEDVTPLVAEAYEKDHRGLDAAFNGLSRAVSSGNPLSSARATTAF